MARNTSAATRWTKRVTLPFSMPISSPEVLSRLISTQFRILARKHGYRIIRQQLRSTNLMHLNVDTSWYVRYRSATNPDLGSHLSAGDHSSESHRHSRNDADFNGATNPNFPGNNHIQAIANMAAFHFGYIEQGGSSLYAALSRKVTDPEVLEVTLGIGGDEIAHFLEWVDFAGNGSTTACGAVYRSCIRPVVSLIFSTPPHCNPPNLVQPSLIFPSSLRIHQPQPASRRDYSSADR